MSCDIEATIDQRPIEATIEGAIVNITGGAGGLVDGDYGDIAVSGAGTVWTIENMAETATVTTGTYASNVNQALLIKARKASAGTITKGQVVYITGSSGTHLLVELARADAEATSAYAIGIATTTITNTTDGFVMQAGRLTGLSTLPTATFTNGQALYLSETTAGEYRVGIPTAPNHGVFLGFVVNASNGGAGVLDVRMQNYQELEELSDVYVNNEAGNDFLMRNSSNTRWENITPANVKTVLAINNVDNTSDLNKPISTATQTALNNKVDKITGKGLSTEDYTTAEKNKLAGIEAGAEVNVNADWNAVSGDAQILNKPSIPTQYTDELAQDAVGGILTDTTSIDAIYDDANNTISFQREALTGAITASKNSNTTALGSFTLSQLNTALSDADVATGGGTATGTNTGDQTSIAGITGTKAQFNTAVTDGNFLYVGDVTQYTDEQAQDAVGNSFQDSASIDFTYNDAGNFITGTVKSNTTIQQVELIKGGSPVFSTRKQLNFIEGSNITINISDDPINDRADITIDSTASSSFTYPQLVSIISLRV